MPLYTSEEKIILTIKAICISQKKLSIRRAAEIYNISKSTLSDYINNRPRREKTRVKDRKLDLLEKQTLV